MSKKIFGIINKRGAGGMVQISTEVGGESKIKINKQVEGRLAGTQE